MELEQIIRQIYRIPITETDDVSVKINGEKHEVVNLGSHGIGVLLKQADSLDVNNQTHDVDLRLNGERLLLKGKIVHVTPYSADHYLCGMKLINLDDASQEKLLACVYRIRANLFNRN